jgi:hypothetical protein
VNLADVMDEIADQLLTIDGLRVYAWPPDSIEPPAAIVTFPRIDYDQTMRRGADRYTLPIVVAVGIGDARSAKRRLGAYCDGGGTRSIKTVVEAHAYVSCDSIRVGSAEFDPIVVGGVEYLAATFETDIAGPGAP